MNTRLEAEVARLRDRVEELESLLFGAEDEPLPFEWRLTAAESRLFRALCARDIASKDYLHRAVVASDHDEDQTEPKIVDVYICKIRKKLKPYGVEVLTHWGLGHSVAASVRDLYKAKGKPR